MPIMWTTEPPTLPGLYWAVWRKPEPPTPAQLKAMLAHEKELVFKPVVQIVEFDFELVTQSDTVYEMGNEIPYTRYNYSHWSVWPIATPPLPKDYT